jgi:hypothetical protein
MMGEFDRALAKVLVHEGAQSGRRFCSPDLPFLSWT